MKPQKETNCRHKRLRVLGVWCWCEICGSVKKLGYLSDWIKPIRRLR